jgi:hypothetical protein
MRQIILIATFIINFLCGYSYLGKEVVIKEGELMQTVSKGKLRHKHYGRRSK